MGKEEEGEGEVSPQLLRKEHRVGKLKQRQRDLSRCISIVQAEKPRKTGDLGIGGRTDCKNRDFKR